MDATWHARPRGSATRTRAARLRGAFIYILYIHYLTYKTGLCPPLYGEGHTYRNRRVLYTRQFHLTKSVWDYKFLTYLPCRRRGATTGVGSRGQSIDGRRSRGARTTGSDQRHVPNKTIITAGSYATWQHLARQSRGGGVHRRSIKHVS